MCASENVYKKIITNGIEINNYILNEDRKIHYNQMSTCNELDNTLYDLIKADLVEKVEVF